VFIVSTIFSISNSAHMAVACDVFKHNIISEFNLHRKLGSYKIQ